MPDKRSGVNGAIDALTPGQRKLAALATIGLALSLPVICFDFTMQRGFDFGGRAIIDTGFGGPAVMAEVDNAMLWGFVLPALLVVGLIWVRLGRRKPNRRRDPMFRGQS